MSKTFKKAIVKTVSDKHGDYMYIDTSTGFVIEPNRPVVAQVTPFLSQKIADGLIKLLIPNLPNEANDAEFLKHYAEFKDVDNGDNAAAASYASKFAIDEAGNATGEYVPAPKEKTEEELMAELEAEAAASAKAAENANKEAVTKSMFTRKK